MVVSQVLAADGFDTEAVNFEFRRQCLQAPASSRAKKMIVVSCRRMKEEGKRDRERARDRPNQTRTRRGRGDCTPDPKRTASNQASKRERERERASIRLAAPKIQACFAWGVVHCLICALPSRAHLCSMQPSPSPENLACGCAKPLTPSKFKSREYHGHFS